MKVLAELNERGNRVHVSFPFDEGVKNAIKYRVPGSKFVPANKGGPCWALPLDLTSMRRLREEVGTALVLGPQLKAWGREEVQRERNLRSLAVLDDYPIEEMKIYKKLPGLAVGNKETKRTGWKGLRPYQRADIKFLAEQTGALNLNEQRLGKTPEIIGTIYEADAEDGPILICGLQKSLDSVWRYEFGRFTDLPFYSWHGAINSTERAKTIVAVERLLDQGRPFVLATTADMIRRGLPDQLEMVVEWSTFVIDEFHKTGLSEIKNVFPKKAQNIKANRKYAMSGTPMGGKPIKLFGALNFLHPNQFTSKWRWAEQWLVVTKGFQDHKEIGGIQKGREDEFYASLASFAVRRLRTEVLPQLPPKQHVEVWCEMSTKQRAQYDVFARDAEIRIDEYHLSATSILAEYTRLKQFSNARCEIEVLGPPDEDTGAVPMKVVPTFDSGKLPDLLERLIEQGIDPEDPTGTSQAIVSSQFREHIEMVSAWLTSKGVSNAILSGKTKKTESERIQKAFKAGNDNEGLRVCCIVTTMGVGITLDNVETIHCIDETWNPDDGEQLADRAIDTTRNHQVTVFWYRSKGSIEEMIFDVTREKADINKEILDLRRQGFRATGGKK